MKNFEAAGDTLVNQMMAAMDAFGDIIMADSKEQCPVETGTLLRSARSGKLDRTGMVHGAKGRFVAKSAFFGSGQVIIGYGFGDEINPKTHRPASEYAVPVHEIIEAYHEPPTKAKFLEDPVLSHASEMEPYLASYMRLEGAPAVAAFIEGDAAFVEKDAGARIPDLDAGDHPKGTPHD